MPHLSRIALLAAVACIFSVSGCESASAPADNERIVTVLTPEQVTIRGGISFIRGWELGRRVAIERSAPTLVFFTAPWCIYCKRMESAAFSDPAVVRLAADYVCVLVDANEEPAICRQLQIAGYPSIELISPAGYSLGRLTGCQSAARLAQSLQAALQRYARLEQGSIAR